MSRNLCSSYCVECGHGPVRLSDLRGKPIEFRQYGPYVPVIGCRWDCPDCGTAYFAIWRTKDEFWSRESLQTGAWKDTEFITSDGMVYPIPEAGRFAVERTYTLGGVERTDVHNTGCFTIDLSYYETYNDEPLYDDDEDGSQRAAIRSGDVPPWHLCTGDAKDLQWAWGDHYAGKGRESYDPEGEVSDDQS